MSKFNSWDEHTLCEQLFAQGARCGYMEAGCADHDGADHYLDSHTRWTAAEAAINAHPAGFPTMGMLCAWAFGYSQGFSQRKRGFELSAEIQETNLDAMLLNRARDTK